MELTRPGYAVVYVILLCALAQGGSEGKRGKDDDSFRDSAAAAAPFSSSLRLHAQQAEVVLKHCRNKLTERNNDVKDFELHTLERSSDMRSILLIENDINKATKSLPPHMIQNFLDCIIRTSTTPPASVSEHKASSRYLLTSGHGRNLITEEPPPPPPPFKLKTYAPRASPPKNDDETHMNKILVAVAVSGIIILMGLCLCYREVRKSKVEKDDMPILVLTSKDYSGSQKVVRLGNAYAKQESGIKDGEIGHTSSFRCWSIKAPKSKNTSLVETKSSEAVGQAPAPPAAVPAPPPPGPPPPPPPRPPAPAPRPPPPARAGHPPPAPPKPMAGKKLGPKQDGPSEGDAPKPKLKPFFWDKVAAKPDQSMVWHELSAGSFVFNEEKMESLFGCTNQNRNERKKDSPSIDNSIQYIQIIDPKKAQNLSILLRALNVTTVEVVDALKEGNEIPVELIQTLLKMAPTTEEELKLRLFTGELSQLGPAERFLKVLVDIPFAFKRLESLMFMFILPEEASSIKDSFATLEVASSKLRKSRLFLKLLEAVLKTGNRMNDGSYRGGAQAFRLDTLLKLSDVKGTDSKTTLLHFVVQEIIRYEGVRAVRTEKQSMSSVATEDFIDDGCEESAEHYRSLGLQVVSSLSSELEDVKKAAIIDGDSLSTAVSRLGHLLATTEEFLNTDLKNLEEESEFKRSVERFVEKAKGEVTWLVDEEKRIMALVKSTADYFHGNTGKDEGLRLFLVVRDFLIILDKVCKEVKDTTMKAAKAASNHQKKESSVSVPSSPDTRRQNLPPSDLHRKLFPAIAGRRVDDDFSSDDDEDCTP